MSKKILIVDDDNLIRKSLGAALQAKGYEIVEAANGQEGLDKALELVPDLVIADVRMPEMDGFTMIEKLREDPKGQDLKVIILSTDDQTTSVNQAMQAGVNVYLDKINFDPQSIADQVDGILGGI
jgi:two-component system chemotaxis response regulator CheY